MERYRQSTTRKWSDAETAERSMAAGTSSAPVLRAPTAPPRQPYPRRLYPRQPYPQQPNLRQLNPQQPYPRQSVDRLRVEPLPRGARFRGHWEDVPREALGEVEASEQVDPRGRRLLFLLLFWFALAASVELWFLDTPPGSVSGVPAVLTAAGRITGMIAGFVLLAQMLLMSRVAWLERWIGAHELLIWHRTMGGYVIVAVLAHVVLIIMGYAGYEDVSVAQETWSMFSAYQDIISAFIATGLLVLIGVLSIRLAKRKLPYEIWYAVHLSSYAVLLLGYGHQFADGAELMRQGFGRRYWEVLYVFVIACLFWGRVMRPWGINLRHRLRVVKVVEESPDTVSIYVGGRHLDRLQVRAGQYLRWRFLMRRSWFQAHPFSLSAAPNNEWLRLTVKAVGRHTEDLQYLVPGIRVMIGAPSGVFTAERRVHQRALLIAGGSGIGPIRALLEDLPPGAVVIYRAGSADELVLREELDWLARRRGARVCYVLGSREDPGPKRVFTPRGMRELVPDVYRRDVYLCGPSGLITAATKTLRRLHLPNRQIHLDPFEF